MKDPVEQGGAARCDDAGTGLRCEELDDVANGDVVQRASLGCHDQRPARQRPAQGGDGHARRGAVGAGPGEAVGSRDAARLATRQPLVANPASSQLSEGRTMSADRHHERPCQRAMGPSPKAGRDRPATPWASAATRRQRCRLRSQPSAPARWCPADPPASRPAARCRQRADAGGRRCPTRTASRPAAPGPRRSATPWPSMTPVGGVGRDRGALVRGPSASQAGRRPPRRPGSSRARGGEESLEGLGPIAGGGRR